MRDVMLLLTSQRRDLLSSRLGNHIGKNEFFWSGVATARPLHVKTTYSISGEAHIIIFEKYKMHT